MILNELFNKGVEWKCTERKPFFVEYEFKVSGKPFSADFACLDTDMQIWEFLFRREDKSGFDRYYASGDGDQFQVFATIKEIFDDFVQYISKQLDDEQKQMFHLSFDADEREPSRVALYARMVKQISKRYPELNGETEGNKSVITFNTNSAKRAMGEGANLFELFNKEGTQWTLTTQSRSETVYSFKIGETPFNVTFELERRDGDLAYSVVFGRTDIAYKDVNGDGKGPFNITGDGDAIKVFSAVVDVIGDFLKRNEDGIPICFSADTDEPSRVRLYKRMIQKATDRFPDWTGVDEGNAVFTIMKTDPSKRRPSWIQ